MFKDLNHLGIKNLFSRKSLKVFFLCRHNNRKFAKECLIPLCRYQLYLYPERFTIYPSQTGSVQLTLRLLNNIGVFLE